jgi:hypothetical protein
VSLDDLTCSDGSTDHLVLSEELIVAKAATAAPNGGYARALSLIGGHAM